MTARNYQTNTGHRFISKGKTAYRISIHTPHDDFMRRAVGFVRIGEKKGLRKAIKIRNELGQQLWGKFWPRILNTPDLIIRLPHTLEPKLLTVRCGTYEKSGPIYYQEVYQASWSDRTGKRHCRKYSTNKHGKLGAYAKAKREMLKAHEDVIDILLFMGRISTIDLK